MRSTSNGFAAVLHPNGAGGYASWVALGEQGKEAMNVEEALAQNDQMPEDCVLVAKPPLVWGAEARFVQLTEDFLLPQSIKDAGYEYVLDYDDIQDLLKFLRTKAVSSRTVAEFVIHYALTDATPAWIDDIPDI